MNIERVTAVSLAPESAGVESQRQRLLQRGRVLESCIAELEARRLQVERDNERLGGLLARGASTQSAFDQVSTQLKASHLSASMSAYHAAA